MATGHLARNRSLSMGSGHSSKGRTGATVPEFSLPPNTVARHFDACAATASMFLYAYGSMIVCAHHDTLKVERVFARHTEDIQLLAVDTVSDRGAGRLVVSYDAGQTAIVWDIMTGDEIARFASYEHLSVAAWMRNGNVAFGNTQGNVILFEPSTSEHISARTIDQIPITALAPAADCRTYAIGYQNGSLLIAALQPRFTILHNLSTSRSPSPIVTLAWHASSSRQKSDMLATQTNDGDVRVWSIAKSPSSTDPAKVVRVLKRTDNAIPGPNWLGWSKNGRIIQFTEGETWSWDVRTKHVACESVPTLDHVRGLAVYGPGATLFTLGANNTAQQFDLNSPPVMVANVQHPANLLPPSPPVSIEEQRKEGGATPSITAIPVNVDVSESDEDHMSPLARIAREMDRLENQQEEPDRSGALSPVSVSSRSQASTSSRTSGNHMYPKHGSVISRGMSDGTTMSLGSSLHTSREPSVISSRDSISMSSMSSHSQTSSHRSRVRPSRLRQEILRSPEEQKQVTDLFPFTKSRLSDVPYNMNAPGGTRLTNDDLRRQMLSTVFGWHGEAEDLIQDELSRHTQGSPSRLLLSKWLGDIDIDIMATSSESMTSSDWMLLALSGIGGTASQHKVARAYVQRLLEKGDVHTAATIMIGMGDQNDAVEIYVSHKRYMEAVILTCLVFPNDWSRLSELVKKWGEWAIKHSQQQLAIRCFACTGRESTEPWTSPSAQALTFNSSLHTQSIPELLSPPLSPPALNRGPKRDVAKTSALKLITSFGDPGKSKFFGAAEGDQTPINIGATPIAESALSPGGDTAHTAFLRPGHRSVFNTPASARTATPGGFTRKRLPSIGEMPTDVLPIAKAKVDPARLPTPADSGSDQERKDYAVQANERKVSQPDLLLTSATYQPISRAATASPMMQKTKQARAENTLYTLPSPSPDAFSNIRNDARTRNGSRDRKPDGLQIQWPPMESIITGEYMTSPEIPVQPPRPRTSNAATRSVAGSVSSVSSAGRNFPQSPMVSERSYKSRGAPSPVVTGRSLDQYISSLESAQYYSQKQRSRQSSRERDQRSGRARSSSRKPAPREPSQDRGRSGVRYIKPAKRSPTSPVPMSPDDFRDFGPPRDADDDSVSGHSDYKRTRDVSQATTIKARSKPGSRVRRSSPDALPRLKIVSKPSSRTASRSRGISPDGFNSRGRSKGREGSAIRSPSSPLPMSPQARFYQQDDEDDLDLIRAKAEQERFRSRNRSTSRFRERGTSATRGGSPDRQRRDRSASRKPTARSNSKAREVPDDAASQGSRRERPSLSHSRTMSDSLNRGDLVQLKTARALKKELAARELEERRKSLARRPSAPSIVHPEDLALLSPLRSQRGEGSPELLRSSTYPSPGHVPPRSQTTSPGSMMRSGTNRVSPTYAYQSTASGSNVSIGLPATPRAMRHPKYDPDGKDIPEVPQMPQIPESRRSPPALSPPASFGSLNAVTEAPTAEPSLLLPRTTYQAAPRHIPPRSMSAPIPEEPPLSPHPLPADLPTHPAFQSALPPSMRRRDLVPQGVRASQLPPTRKVNPGESQPGQLGYESRNNNPTFVGGQQVYIGGIDEALQNEETQKNMTPPPPPPPPPVPPLLRELQHLAIPPPPPPAPIAPMFRPGDANTNSVNSGVSTGSGVIEIVMDDDESSVPVIEVPPPPSRSRTSSVSGRGHNRGRSVNENSISSRISRATDRIRSASRGRNSSPMRHKSPQETSPYESIPPLWTIEQQQQHAAKMMPPPMPTLNKERHPRDVKAAMQGYIEGGMI